MKPEAKRWLAKEWLIIFGISLYALILVNPLGDFTGRGWPTTLEKFIDTYYWCWLLRTTIWAVRTVWAEQTNADHNFWIFPSVIFQPLKHLEEKILRFDSGNSISLHSASNKTFHFNIGSSQFTFSKPDIKACLAREWLVFLTLALLSEIFLQDYTPLFLKPHCSKYFEGGSIYKIFNLYPLVFFARITATCLKKFDLTGKSHTKTTYKYRVCLVKEWIIYACTVGCWFILFIVIRKGFYSFENFIGCFRDSVHFGVIGYFIIGLLRLSYQAVQTLRSKPENAE